MGYFKSIPVLSQRHRPQRANIWAHGKIHKNQCIIKSFSVLSCINNEKLVICDYMNRRKTVEIIIPTEIGDGRLDTILKVFSATRRANSGGYKLRLNWKKVEKIAPSGFAILACLCDTIVEQKCPVTHVFVKQQFKEIPVIHKLLHKRREDLLPPASDHNSESKNFVLRGGATAIDMSFMEIVAAKWKNLLTDDLEFTCRLIINELMQNTVDHSNAERYYLYAGIWGNTFQFGVLDMGITIPAKLSQKYTFQNDIESLECSLICLR